MDGIVSAACTLPDVDRPLRVAEFESLFATVRSVERPEPRRLSITLEPAFAGQAADLAVRETLCCSFFEFAVIATGAGVRLEVQVPTVQTGVLDALQARART
jgi:hypothetical protein